MCPVCKSIKTKKKERILPPLKYPYVPTPFRFLFVDRDYNMKCYKERCYYMKHTRYKMNGYV